MIADRISSPEVPAAAQPAARTGSPPPIPRRGESTAPVSFPQLRLWFLDQLEPDSPLHHIAYAVRLRGALDVRALERSLAAIVQRHEILRSTFHPQEEEPRQRVAPAGLTKLPVVDLASLPANRRAAEARRLALEEARQPFRFESGPLVRFRLFRLGATEHVLVLVWHNIVFDGGSEAPFCAELNSFYAAFQSGASPVLPELPIQYTDFANWQRDRLRGAELESSRAYWKTKLAGQSEAEGLPTDRPEPALRTLRGGMAEVELERELADAVRALSGEAGVAPSTVLLAALQTLLYRYTGQDVTLGVLTDGRSVPETEHAIGFFVNTLPLRTELSSNPSFREALGRVRRSLEEAFAHGELPFEKIVELLQPERALSRNPLFRIMFVMQAPPLAGLALTGLEADTEELFAETAGFDLTLVVTERHGGIRLRAEYSLDLFDGGTIERLLRNFQHLLSSAVAHPQAQLAELEMLSPQDRQEVLVALNETAAEFPRELCVHQLVEAQAANAPDEVAAVFAPHQLTYRELDAQAEELAAYLRALGVGPDDCVGLYVERSLEMLVGLLGVLKAGGAYVPLDPDYPPDRLAYMMKDAGVRVLLTQRRLEKRLPPGAERVIMLDEPVPAAQASVPAAAVVNPEHLAYVIYTSGSTGQPKGVAMPHRALVNLLTWQARDSRAGRGTRTAQFTSLSFDVSFQEIFSTWSTGGTLVLIAQATRRDPTALWKLLADARVERLYLPFVALQQLAEVAADSDLTPRHLREVITAGEQLQITHKVVDLFERLPGCTLHNHYGPTESHVVTAHTLAGPPRSWPPLPPIGRPIQNTRIYLLDPHGQPLPAGVPGELYISGDCLARGYLGQPGLTEARFLPETLSGRPGQRLYRTGDLARYLTDGSIEFLGRLDHQVKLRGFRVELGEIEATLRRHPQVADCAVVAREIAPGDKRLMAYLTTRAGARPASADLAEHVRATLPDYMVPAVFILLEEFPLTPSGKVDRKALLGRQEQMPEASGTVAPPRTPVEEALVAIWCEVLHRRQVGIHDNFFDLGGHSLLAIQVVNHVNKAGLGLSLNQIFQYQTIAELAAVADTNQTVESGTDEWFSLVTLQPKGERPPFFLIHSAPGDLLGYMRLVYHLGNDQPCYGFQSFGLFRQGAAHSTIEAMAAHYVKLLREFQPEGPYYLGGWCFGGNVAVEMAWQLADQGQKVALLAVVEGWAFRPPLKYWRFYWHHFLCLAWSGPHGIFRRAWSKLRARFTKDNRDADPPEQFAFEAARSGPLVNRERVYKINLEAVRRYRSRPAVYPGRITLFLREKFGDGVVVAKDCGFASLARETRTVLVPGDHVTVLHEPHVRALAAKLKEALVQAQAETVSEAPPSTHGQPKG